MAQPTTAPAVPSDAEIEAVEAQVTVPPQGGYVAFTCPDTVSKNNDVTYDPSLKDDPSAADQGRMDEGRAYETELGERWAAALGTRIILIPECDRSQTSKARREQLTMAAMANPGDAVVIWNARIPAVLENRTAGILPRIAEPDFLVLHGRKDDGTPVWAPGDAKHHKTFEGTTQNLLWQVSTMETPQLADAQLRDMGEGIPKVKPSKQLAHYRRVLEHYGYAQVCEDGEPYWACTIGKEGVLIWRDLNAEVGRPKKSPQAAYDEAFEFRIQVIRRARARAINPAIPPLVRPDWCTDCKTGPWRTVVHDEMKFDMDHIALLQGITPARLGPHVAQGIVRVADLARLDYATAAAVDLGLDVPELITAAKDASEPSAPAASLLKRCKALDSQIQALTAAGVRTVGDVAAMDPRTAKYAGSKVWNLAGTIDMARVAKVDQVCRARGVDWVNIPRATIEIDIDIEDADGIVYLIGARALGTKRVRGEAKVRIEMHSFVTWEHTDEAEARNFAEFWAYVVKMREYASANKYGIRFYHYTSKEVSTFRALAEKHAGVEGVPTVLELDRLFGSKDWVDMYPIIAKQLIWPTESLSLKYVARRAGHDWRDEAAGGDNSIAWYREAAHNPDRRVREDNRHRVVVYNEDDVIAQAVVRDWLSKFGEARKPGQKLPSVKDIERRFRRSARPLIQAA